MTADTPRTALITGASGGIGYELARLFAQDGYRLLLVSRNREQLKEIAVDFATRYQVEALPMPHDLAIVGSAKDLYAEVERRGLAVDVLINNAGFGTYGFFADTDLIEEEQEMQLNMVSLTTLTKLFLRPMLARGSGKIMNVASTAGFQPGPLMAVYYATKAYVISFSAALANEVRGTGVTVSVLCPGLTRTGFQQRAGIQGIPLLNTYMMDAATVARIGYRGMHAGKTLIIPGLRNKLLAFLVKLGPRSLVTSVVRRIQEHRTS